MSTAAEVEIYHGNQLGAPDVDCAVPIHAPQTVKVWSKPYPLAGGEAIYYGVSPSEGESDLILVPFKGNATINWKSTFSDAVVVKFQGQGDDDIFTKVNDVLYAVYNKIKLATSSDLEKKFADGLDGVVLYPRKDLSLNAKMRSINGTIVTTFPGHADFDAFKKKALQLLAKKKICPLSGIFLVQGAVLSERGIDVCVKLWEASVRK